MQTFTGQVMTSLLEKSLDTARVDASGWHDVGRGPGSSEGEYIDWLTIDDGEKSVVRDVRRLRSHPLVPGYIPIHGYIYDVKTGRLVEVAEATKVGRPA
jgi:carbonic anhydrase